MRRSDLEPSYRRAIHRVFAGSGGRGGRPARGGTTAPPRTSDRRARREAEIDPPIDLRIGRASAPLDGLLARHGATTWAFLSAVNPGSKRLPDAENRRRTRRLAAAIARRGWTRYRGAGLDPSGGWPEEPSFLVLDAPLEEVVALAARFGQAAIVHGTAGGRARLRWIDRSSRSRSRAGARALR